MNLLSALLNTCTAAAVAQQFGTCNNQGHAGVEMMHPLKQCIQQQQHGPQSRCQGSSSTRWSHGRSSSSRCGRQQSSSRRLNPTAALVEPGQLAVIAAEPVAEVALLAGVGAACARQGLLPLQGR